MTVHSVLLARRIGFGLAPLIACLVACGDAAPPLDAPDLVLPEAAILGAAPPSFGRVDITVTGDGVLTVNGRACTFADLGARLLAASGGLPGPERAAGIRRRIRTVAAAEGIEDVLEEAAEETEEVVEAEITAEEPVIQDAEIVDDGGPIDFRAADAARRNPKTTVVELPPRDPGPRIAAVLEPDASRPADVLLRIDRRVPWCVVARVLIVCAHPELKLYRHFIAVRDPLSQEPGAIAIFLPKDLGLCGGRIVVGTSVRVALRPRRDGVPPMPVAASLARRRTRPGDALFVSLRSAPLTPWAAVVAVAVEALRAGAYSFTFEGSGAADEGVAVAEWIVRSAKAGPFDAHVGGSPVSAPPRVRPVADGRRRGYFGYSNGVTMGDEEIETEDEDSGK